MDKYATAEEATDDTVAHAHFTLATKGCKQTLRICNTCCFSTATTVARRRLNVTLYAHCLSCTKEGRVNQSSTDMFREGSTLYLRKTSQYSFTCHFFLCTLCKNGLSVN